MKSIKSGHLAGVVAFALTTSFAGAAWSQAAPVAMENVPISDIPYEQITSFEQIRLNWVRRAQEGPIKRDYDVQVVKEFPAAEPIFKPEPGGVYIYENTGRGGHPDRAPEEKTTSKSNRIIVLDAKTREVVAWNEFAPELAGSIHTTALSPDGKNVYSTGPVITADSSKEATGLDLLALTGTVIKADALSLAPTKVLNVGGRLHHAFVWKDEYMIMDTFSREAGGLDVFVFDPKTDAIIGGVRDEELGGATYTSYLDPAHEYLYILMEPTGYTNNPMTEGYLAAGQMRTGALRWAKPFWVAKLRLSDWTVVQEYPYPGYRSDWLQFSPDGKFFYVNGSGDDKVIKINVETGEVVWSQATGPGPYGIEVNGDGSQVWVADKGETASMFGRTITVINAETGKHISTLPSAYMIDHIVLSPNGKEMWATSNGEGKLWVYDSDNRKLLDIINMPGFGDAHGLVFVAYDDKGVGRVVADQGDFHGGVDPRNGKPLNY
ncbi:MAG: hypothetical protein K0B00_03905 [Rhodobacteraceae bacterium]|nr:hypothetical protein [Paracoccaceae bacterium]